MSLPRCLTVPASPVMTREVVDLRRARCGSRSEDVGGPVRPRAGWGRGGSAGSVSRRI